MRDRGGLDAGDSVERAHHPVSDALHRAVVETAVDGIIVINAAGIVQAYNAACETMFGYAANEVIGRNVKLLMPEPYHGEHDGYLRNYHQTGERKIIGIGREVVGRRKDGSTFPMELSVGEAVQGDETSFVGVLRDITQRKESEHFILESEALHRAVVETAVDGMIVIDGMGIVQAYNAACETMFGYAANEVIGRNVKLLMPAPYRAEHDSYLRNYRETGERKIIGIGREVVGRRKDGSTFPMELSVGEAGHGDGTSFVGVLRDISQRKDSDQFILESGALHRAVVETAVDGIIVIDALGIVQAYNPACERMFGYAADEVVGQNVKLLMPEPYRAEDDGYPRSYHGNGERKIIGIGREVVGRRKDGSTFPMELSVGEAAQGDETSFVGVLRDITQRKRFEDEMRQSNASLLAANSELEGFTYSVSHDLRAPLRAIEGYVRILREDHADALDAEGQRVLNVVIKNSVKMSALIDDLLAFSRLGKTPLSREAVPMEALAKHALQEALSPEDRDVEMHVGALPDAFGDAATLRQVWVNLIGNAIKYSRGRAPAVIRVSAQQRPGVVEYSVADNGIGFDMAYKDKLFTVFERLHKPSEFEGTGVGLALVQRIVARHGGQVWGEARPGLGATFTFSLPTKWSKPDARE